VPDKTRHWRHVSRPVLAQVVICMAGQGHLRPCALCHGRLILILFLLPPNRCSE
jgi:hypothetical protein